MSKIFNLLSSISVLVTILIIYLFTIFISEWYFNGYIVLLLLLMFINPVLNIFRLNKKIIDNPIYHIMIMSAMSYISYIFTNSFNVYKKYLIDPKDNSEAVNNALNYTGEHFICIILLVLFLIILGFIFKKRKIESNKDNSKIDVIFIIILSFLSVITGINSFTNVFMLTLLIFSILTFIHLNRMSSSFDTRGYYLILIILSILSVQPIALVISICLFIQLDKFGLCL